MRFPFIEAEKAKYPITVLCRVMQVTRSGYYAWKIRPLSDRAKEDERLATKLKTFHKVSNGYYGSPRLHGDLIEDGERVGRKRVERLMLANGLRGKQRRKFRCTTDSNHDHKLAPNLLKQDFSADRPNTIWASDITELWTPEGKVYLAVVLDLFARYVVGWAIANRMPRQLVLDAVTMAIMGRHPEPGLIFHSDKGSQYAADDTQNLLEARGITASMSGTGNCYDNAVSESLFARLKEELGDSFASRPQARAELFEYLAVFYNNKRRHSYNGNLTPLQCEQFFARHGRRPAGIADILAESSTASVSQPSQGGGRGTDATVVPIIVTKDVPLISRVEGLILPY